MPSYAIAAEISTVEITPCLRRRRSDKRDGERSLVFTIIRVYMLVLAECTELREGTLFCWGKQEWQ